MDNRYTNIIDSQAGFFMIFLQGCLSVEMRMLLHTISTKTDVYIYSGIIRNFFLGESDFRDLDIVVGDVKCAIDAIKAAGLKVKFRVNSFGGVKIKIQNLTIDLWGLKYTWGIQNKKFELTPKSLLKTAFFNFSAIVFDYNNRKFYYDDAFLNFLRYKIMDVVYEENPNEHLCIINSCYYRKVYGFGLSRRLCKWIFDKHLKMTGYERSKEKFNQVQLQHFARVIISYEEIKEFIFLCYRYDKIGRPILYRSF